MTKEVNINWSEEIRRSIEMRIREYRKKKILEEIDTLLSDVPKAKAGTARSYVRKDRDSR